MAHSIYHAKSSVRQFGGEECIYLPIHNWFDASKAIRADFRHRSLRHHKEGIGLARLIFGQIVANQIDEHNNIVQTVTIDQIGEQHQREDFQFVPDASQWYKLIKEERWMKRSLNKEKGCELIIKKFGGEKEDYYFLYDFFNQFNDPDDARSKFILNHSLGIFTAEEVFGITFVRESDSKELPTRTVAENLISLTFGKIPTPSEWIETISEDKWMFDRALKLSQTL